MSDARTPLPFAWRAAVFIASAAAFALLAWVAAHWIWRWASPRPSSVAGAPPADPAATILASGLWSGGRDAPDATGAAPPGDVRLLGVLAERDGKGLAVFRTREGARVVAAGGEVTAGTTLVAVDVSSVRLRDAGGERTVDMRRDPAAKAGVPGTTRAAGPKSTTPPTVTARTAASAACAPPPGFSGPMLKLHGELLEGLIAQPDSWRPMLASDSGALVVREDGGFAAMIGLARGDRIAQANGIALLQPDDVTGAVLRPLVASQTVRLAGSRSGQPREVYIVNAGACP